MTTAGCFILNDSSAGLHKKLIYLELKQRKDNKSERAKIYILKTN